ncbi:hypothetical protein ACPCHQ_11730 [Ralstonia thomasii]|jgi:hypothetical protein|uniref:Uncharacterized protein n=2 Tax=Ralstonia TaxID=48736 RepID=A0ABN9ISU6_9RALS|nr:MULTISPECIES: hypothetical protein [Ralstonia]MBT2177762.1 hypothetical protein [Ralstonia pickettii]CAJ0710641.1 hypothetical protein LMG7143_01662 [Ralstonia sp. LMG 18095]CAJ0792060.1 hypothetical protein LMG18095_02260 [Ralstonia sp. LMG 18095]
MISIAPIDQLREQGKQAARDGLPMSVNPYPYGSCHAMQWEHGFMWRLLDPVVKSLEAA